MHIFLTIILLIYSACINIPSMYMYNLSFLSETLACNKSRAFFYSCLCFNVFDVMCDDEEEKKFGSPQAVSNYSTYYTEHIIRRKRNLQGY